MDPGSLTTDELIETLRRRLSGTEAEVLTVGAVWERYAEWGRQNKPSWLSMQACHWPHLDPFWAHKVVYGITLQDADAYRAWRTKQLTPWGTPVKPATRNREMCSLAACFRWAVKRKLLKWSPLANMDMEREDPGRRYVVTPEVLALLLRHAVHPAIRLATVILHETGLRRGELLDLTWEQVDLAGRLITLGDGDVKNGTGRTVPVTETALEAFAEAPRWSRWVLSVFGGPISKSWFIRRFIVTRKKAGVSHKCKVHSLRHTASVNMRRAGVPHQLCRMILGHKSEKAAQVYQHLGPEDWVQFRECMDRKGPQRIDPPETSARTRA